MKTTWPFALDRKPNFPPLLLIASTPAQGLRRRPPGARNQVRGVPSRAGGLALPMCWPCHTGSSIEPSKRCPPGSILKENSLGGREEQRPRRERSPRCKLPTASAKRQEVVRRSREKLKLPSGPVPLEATCKAHVASSPCSSCRVPVTQQARDKNHNGARVWLVLPCSACRAAAVSWDCPPLR